MIEVFGAFFILLVLGTVWRFIPHVPDADTVRRSLGGVVMNFFLPGLTFSVLYKAPLNSELWQVPAVAIVSVFAALSITFIFFLTIKKKLKGITNKSLGALLLAATWGNVTYLGLPTITALLGESYRRVPIYYDLLAMTPLLWTLGVSIADHYGNEGEHLGIMSTIKKGFRTVITLPPFWAAFLGLLCNLFMIPVPEFLLKACSLVGNAVPPMMIFSIGLALRVPHIHHLGWIAPVVAVKLLVAPFIAQNFAILVGLKDEVLRASVIESAMPTMVLTMVVADRFHLDVDLLAQIIAISTVLSFFTVGLLWG